MQLQHNKYSRIKIAFLLLLLVGCSFFVRATSFGNFVSAEPIWPEGRETEKNLFVAFSASFTSEKIENVILRATGSSVYRVYLNDEFLGYGPARGPHGYYRVDEWEIGDKLKRGENVIAFEVAGYNVNSYYLLNQPAFLQAEITSGSDVIASTGGQGSPFRAVIIEGRIQKVQRYSFQRPFSEVYKLAGTWGEWRTNLQVMNSVKCSRQPTVRLLSRGVGYPDYTMRQPSWSIAWGKFEVGLKVEKPWKDRSLTAIGPKLGGYLEADLETVPSLELQRVKNVRSHPIDKPWAAGESIGLEARNYHIVDFGCDLSGFIGMNVVCRKKTRLFLTFDEILSEGDVDFKRLDCVNIVSYELEPGTYELESFEPYTLRYLKMMSLEGDCEIRNIYLREYAAKDVWRGQFAASDERLNRLFAAGRETFRQNAVDIFSDCPSRERAGWLSDSFFTARVAQDLCGDMKIERNFFENYLLPEKFSWLPDGMLPMCYPADHNDGQFIPNWGLWFVLELEEYLKRSGDRETVDALKPRVVRLFQYFNRFKNEDGLLEKLDGWVFVEWSKANSFVQDVNFPSNMLYAKALESAGKIYDMPEMVQEANRVRDVIRKKSFDGNFFVDNAKRVGGKLVVTTNRTEVCQYYAFFTDVAMPESHPKLWQVLMKQFGPQRKVTHKFSEVHPDNALIGNVLRLELLSRYGLCRQLMEESLAYQLYMVDRTGTLWENDSPSASCNHGFASHGGVHVLYRDVLGLQEVDVVSKTIRLRFTDSLLNWCEGTLPTRDGMVEFHWWKNGKKINYKIVVPRGYSVVAENLTGFALARQP